MPKVCEIAQYFEQRVPARLKLDFDNVGLLAGYSEKEVHRVLVALDVTLEVIQEAKDWGAELIVSHHPIILDGVKEIVDSTPRGRRLTALLESGLSAICLHTNLDSVDGGVNDALAEALGANVLEVVEPIGEGPDGKPAGLGRVCELPDETSMEMFLKTVQDRLHVSGLRFYDAGRPVGKITVCGGSGGDMIYDAAACGCDTCLTGEIRYHHWLDGKELGLNLIEADHFCTENVVTPVLREMLLEGFPGLDVKISEVHNQTAKGL